VRQKLMVVLLNRPECAILLEAAIVERKAD
jgi:hypothetical protein